MASTDHDNDIDVDELDSAAVAAAMGFSSFGAQAPPNKKRRFNPQSDNAFVGTPRDGRPPARIQPQSAGTGANATKLPPRPVKTVPAVVPPSVPAPASRSNNLPLHPPQNSAKTAMKLPPPTKPNTDEIDLDDDDEEEDKDVGGGVDLNQASGDNADEEAAPQYIDTSRPVGEVRDHLGGADAEAENVEEEDPAALQARIDAVVAAGNAEYGASGPSSVAQQQLDGTVHSTGRHHGHGGIHPGDRHGFHPELVPGSPGAGQQFSAGDAVDGEAAGSDFGDASSHVGSTDGRGQWQGRGGRGQDHGHGQQRNWWNGYYDPTSNENPWARIEAKLGLPTRGGSWLERGHSNPNHRQRA